MAKWSNKQIHRWLDDLNEPTDSSSSSSSNGTSFTQLLNQLNTQHTQTVSHNHSAPSSTSSDTAPPVTGSVSADPPVTTALLAAAPVAPAPTDVNHPATLNFYSSTSKGFVAGALADVKLTDPDGISGPVTYHWKSIGPHDTQWTDLPQITSDAIILTAADAGKLFDVTATFVDDKGHHESPEHMFKDSDPVTTPPAPPPPSPPSNPTDVNHPATLNFYSSTSKGFVAGALADVKLDDPDGISGPVIYHWKSIGPNDTKWTDMAVTGDTIILTAADAGKLFDVTATFVDDKGHQEAPEHMFKDSDPVGTTPPPVPPPVTPPPPPPSNPSDVNHPASLNFYSSTSKGFVAGALADVKLDDPDGISGPVTYHWKSIGPNDTKWTDMAVTGDTIILTAADAGKLFDVTATFVDDKGHQEAPEHMFKDSDPVGTTTPPPPPVTPPDVDHLGTVDVTSSPGGFAVGDVVTAHVNDTDGLGSGTIHYQWSTVGAGNQLTPIANATGQSYTLKSGDAGHDLEVSATYTDAKSHTATIADSPFHVAAAPPPPPPPDPVPPPPPPSSGDHFMLGINLAGAEFGSAVPGTFGKDYTYPTHQEIDYYASKGMDVIRLPFLWERVQSAENGPLNASELQHIDDVVNYAATKGITVDLDVHNYGQGFGGVIGSTKTPDAAFANLWGQLADHFKGDSNVMFGLMNEPNIQNPSQWEEAANEAIAAIRATGATQEILVPGTAWDGAWTWVSSGNSTAIGTGVKDPLNNFAFEVHQYLDSDGSGTHNNVVSASVGVDRLQAVTQWAEATGNKLFLGEFGVASDQTSLTALNNMLDFMEQHPQAWQGATYWAGGAWWGNYAFSAEPNSMSNPVDKAQMTVLVNHIEPQDHMPVA